MPRKESLTAHIRASLPELHSSVLDIVGIFNSPERDEAMLESAGLTLERALFPLLVLIGKYGPIGVVDLGMRVGRDYTTVSRQVARLEELGLVARRGGSSDRRTREAAVTPQGRAATEAVDRARERLALRMFRNWSREDYDQLLRLTRMLADGLDETPAPGSKLAKRMAQKGRAAAAAGDA
jgi:DNA-binding MarR family transcriptional regulator